MAKPCSAWTGEVKGCKRRRVSRGCPVPLRRDGLRLPRRLYVGRAPLVVLLRQLVPLDRERAAGAAVLAIPVGQEIEAGVVDVVELIDMHVHVRSGLQALELSRELRQPNERRGALQIKV